MSTIIWHYESVWPYVWPRNKCRSLWSIFDGPVILSYILKTIWCMNIIGIMSQYDPKFDLKINTGHCDLYLMVNWFCVISGQLFDVWTSYFGIMGQYDPTFDLKINVGLSYLQYMVHCFCLISPRLFDAWMSYFEIDSVTHPEVLSDPKIAGQLRKNSSGHATRFLKKKSRNFEIPAIMAQNLWVCAKPQHCHLCIGNLWVCAKPQHCHLHTVEKNQYLNWVTDY